MPDASWRGCGESGGVRDQLVCFYPVRCRVVLCFATLLWLENCNCTNSNHARACNAI
jgi:hypothetical protein